MAHTIAKELYSDEFKKYVLCEILVLDEEEGLPDTDRREIILSCSNAQGDAYSEIADTVSTADLDYTYPETELIDQYEDYDAREKTVEFDKKYFE